MSSSRGRKKAALYEKLRAATNSTAMNRASIIVDASKYIQELKKKVDTLNQDVKASQNPSSPAVTVETLEKGFLISVLSEKNCPGLLVSILEAFEDLGLDVLDARVSCADNFRLEAVGGENQGEADSIDAQVVKQAVLQAIQNWSQNN
ncbi:PREDICTED: transcription factor SCREAM2-like isoform X2 [Fragaria vesca subsp. vesca]|uniref:transcription factor SCREAM2-like isoform X2 n=1 Tax=Fragaria vesca subsp. vesca TaxID=101020 RepID=UPI0002C2E2AE|nr:PREDICTED: transcription factor SCREAM2-like isoform X2 [Fragaria vesca subsp. vesca]